MLRVKILGDPNTAAYKAAQRLVYDLGFRTANGYALPDVAIAPLLTQKLSAEEVKEPLFGTLIFHPSPLPYGRGAAAIKWAYKRQEPITAATWFWADERFDAGDICEQEIVKIDYGLRPRDFYEQHIIPALLRTLERALKGIASGNARRVPQVEKYATFDNRI